MEKHTALIKHIQVEEELEIKTRSFKAWCRTVRQTCCLSPWNVNAWEHHCCWQPVLPISEASFPPNLMLPFLIYTPWWGKAQDLHTTQLPQGPTGPSHCAWSQGPAERAPTQAGGTSAQPILWVSTGRLSHAIFSLQSCGINPWG